MTEMRPHAVAIVSALVLAGLIALAALLERHDLGAFAQSPQVLEVPLGARRIAGGGRAVVGAVALDGERAVVDVSCRHESRRLEAGIGEPFEPICGLELLPSQVLGYPDDPDRPQRLLLSVVWDDDAPPDPRRL